MAKAARVHVRERHGTLFYDFLYQGMRCRENTGLRDNPDNRKRCLHEAQRIESEIALGEFEYLRRFPQGNQRHRFTAKPTGDMSFQEFALKVWLPHMQTKLSESTAHEYRRILTARVFPSFGSVSLKHIRPEHLDRLTLYLKGLKGNEGNLSPRRMNIILLRVRQVLDLAFEWEYLDTNPHGWIHLQEERRPRIDPFSFEERQTFEQALAGQQQEIHSLWIFPNADGGRLNLDNLRHRIWYPTLQRAGLRPRDLYQCRHTFASLMLQAGEDPAWVARMLGHTTTRMLYERYHRFIQHRTRQDGALYLKRLDG